MENKKIIKYIFLILVMFFLVYLGIKLFGEKKTTENNNSSQSFLMEKIKIGDENSFGISWLFNSVQLPKQIITVQKTKQEISSDLISKIVKSFGLMETPLVDEAELKLYETPDGKNILSVDTKNKVFQYDQDLLSFPLENPNKILTIKEIEDNLNNLLKTNFGLNQLVLVVKEIKYQNVNVSNFEESDEKNASIVEIRATYSINNFPIYDKHGLPITARFTRDGKLIKLTLNWLEKFQNTKTSKEIKTFEEIKKIPTSEFKIIYIKGEGDYNIAPAGELIKNTTIDGGFFALLNLPEYEDLIPVLILEGKSNLSIGLVSVMLAVPVSK